MSRSMETGFPIFSKWTVTATYALWFGDVHASVAKLRAPVCSYFMFLYIISLKRYTKVLLTCSIFAMRLRTITKTFLTSWETVCGEGIGYSGRPVFMRLRKPRSLTILKGRLLSDTQRTISALQANGIRWWKISGSIKVCHLPGFRWSMLTMRVCYFPFANTFELGRNRSIAQFGLGQDHARTL